MATLSSKHHVKGSAVQDLVLADEQVPPHLSHYYNHYYRPILLLVLLATIIVKQNNEIIYNGKSMCKLAETNPHLRQMVQLKDMKGQASARVGLSWLIIIDHV